MIGGPHLSACAERGEGALTRGRLHAGIVTPPTVSHQDHIEGFLIKQEYTSADTYKLNLNVLKVKILQI
jgi:hypothetical protein